MIKKVAIPDLKIGMYIDNLGVNWLAHDFVRPSFLISNKDILNKVQRSKLKHVFIDTDKGTKETKKTPPPERKKTVKKNISTASALKKTAHTSTQEEVKYARNIVNQANAIMKDMMTNIRLGKQVQIEQMDPVADKIVRSIMRNQDALISLSRIKNKDDYTFMHSVSVSGLMVALARANGMDEQTLNEVAVGGLLHDIGKMITPNKILKKPGKLTDDEFVIMRDHVKESQILLRDHKRLNSNILDVIFQHHEKVDGSGYPLKLHGDQLSTVGKMSAIVDVYDALTSIRVYKTAWEPSVTLKRMMQWTENHLDKQQMINFIHCLGIYPVGSLVEMESGLIGVVQEQHESHLTQPIVKFIYKKNHGYIYAKTVDLSKEESDRIIKSVSPETYGIDLAAFI